MSIVESCIIDSHNVSALSKLGLTEFDEEIQSRKDLWEKMQWSNYFDTIIESKEINNEVE